MGLTIHYQGQLRSATAYTEFIQYVEQFAAARQWPVHPIAEARSELVRMLQPEDPDAAEVEDVYVGPTKGIYLLPHPDCEPLTFEFDRDLFMQDWCKTQFAGPKIHEEITHLFRGAEVMFEMLDVQDETDYWETQATADSKAQLVAAFAKTRQEIDQAAAESPGASVGVLTPSGRILDVLVE